jgi:hypothetical protein
MEAMSSPEKIAKASLFELAKCYAILDKANRAIEIKRSFKIKGLVGLLMEMEKIKDNH